VGAIVAPAVLVAPDPARSGGAAKTSASVIRMKVVNPARATPTRGKEVGAPLAIGTAPGLSRDGEIVVAAPEAGTTAVRSLVAPAKGVGALVLVEVRKSTMTVIPRTKKSEGTKGAAAGRSLQDATGHPVGETSEGISLGMRSRARSCRA
jgi:hypothetical protein